MKKRKNKNKNKPETEREEETTPAQPASSAAVSAPAAMSRDDEPDDIPSGDALSVAMPDSQEPTISKRLLPMVIIPLLALLVYFADMYVVDNSGKFSAMVYDPREDLPKPPGGPSLFEHGKMVYENKAKCLQCHQVDGSGNPTVNAPPLAGSDWVLAEGPNRLIRIVLDGFTGPVTVNKKSYNGTMLPWKDSLTDEDIAAVLTFIRQEWGNNGGPVTVEQVKAIREETAKRPRNWTEPELLAIPDK